MNKWFIGCVSVFDKGRRTHMEKYGILYIVAGMLLVWATFVFKP